MGVAWGGPGGGERAALLGACRVVCGIAPAVMGHLERLGGCPLPALQPCPAADLNNTNKSKYEFSREVSNHRFYKPVTIA